MSEAHNVVKELNEAKSRGVELCVSSSDLPQIPANEAIVEHSVAYRAHYHFAEKCTSSKDDEGVNSIGVRVDAIAQPGFQPCY